MKHLFLTSSVGTVGVGASIRAKLGHDKPLKTVFITTPIEVEDLTDDAWYQADHFELTSNGFETLDYTITGKSESDIINDLKDVEVMYISGGNEFYLKQQSNKNNFGNFVKKFVESGKVYIGTSAGSIIMAPDMSPCLLITDTTCCPEPITDISGFGIVDFLVMPHWGSEDFRDVYLGERKDKMYQENWQLILLNNYEYVEVIDEKYRIVDVRAEK
ncbi:MAG: Type 1 glutamine amidotransferase-like domain-containing protein [bacterium]